MRSPKLVVRALARILALYNLRTKIDMNAIAQVSDKGFSPICSVVRALALF